MSASLNMEVITSAVSAKKCTRRGAAHFCSDDSCQLLLYFIEYVTSSGTYKYDREGLLGLFLMAEHRPTRLDEYCKTTNTSFFDLKLKCVFCHFTVTLDELAEFYCKSLSLVYKDNTCYACCRSCILLSAKHELDNYSSFSVSFDSLSETVHVPLNDIVVRCSRCYRKLDLVEKIDCKARDEKAILVRGHWRARCRYCYKK